MIKKIIIILSHILILFNINVWSLANSTELKIGLLAPFSGEYKNLGNSLLFSTQLALDETNDENIKVIPRDSGSGNKEQLNRAIKEIIDSYLSGNLMESDQCYTVKWMKHLNLENT